MPDFGAPIAQNVDVSPTKGLQTLSDLMGLQKKQIDIQQAQQTLQTGQALQQRAQAEAQGAQQAMTTRQAAQRWGQTGKDDQGNDLYVPGTQEIDPGKFATSIMRLDPTNGPDIAQAAIKTNNDRILLHSSMLGLTMKQREAVMGPMQAAALNPDKDHLDAANASLDSLVQQNPDMAPVADSAKRLLNMAAKNPDPKQRAAMANTFSATYQPGQAVQTQPAAVTQVTGGAVQAGATTPPAAGGGFTAATSTPMTIGPGEVERLEQDPVSGQAVIVRRATNGTIVSARPAAGLGGGGGGPPTQAGAPTTPPGFTAIPPGETKETLAQLQAQRAASNTAALQTGSVASNNKQILGLLNAGTTTGSNAPFIQKWMSSVGLQWTSDEGKNLDQIAHYLSLQQQANEKAMGVRTDAGAEISGLASGTIRMSTDALKSATKANDALNTGTSVFNTGLEKAIAQRGIGAARTFQNQWASNFDPSIYRYANAIASQDQAEQTRIEKLYGKPAAGKIASPDSSWGHFLTKMRNLDSLEKNGGLPAPTAGATQ